MKTTTTSFRVDEDNAELLDAVSATGRNKSEFINEAIKMHGPFLVKKIEQDHAKMQELKKRNKALKEALTKDKVVPMSR